MDATVVVVDPRSVVALIASFAGGFLMTWLRGYRWFGDGATATVALAGGWLATWLLGAHLPIQWVTGTMEHTLTVAGAVHFGGNLAKARAMTNLPPAVMPKFNELSKEETT